MIARLLAAMALGAALTACGGGGDSSPQSFEVKYGAMGYGGVDVTYATPGGGTGQEHLPNGVTFSKTYTAKAGDFIYVSAQNNSSDANAAAVAEMYVNGKPYRIQQSTGPFVIATVSATCCD